ncbi:MAG: aquaporin family protein [Rhodothermaceae bacterium]|nr:aquaporin family protein [Rhodothermaceae bacterium]MXZ57176.1 aquaporin family protein [Rhodothermaceae bacterium]MYB90874.1 aquaporin family protein [Rhodothermaceae bacterium]MYD68860.1 aquaporin family protein [Rhodothermaceae bacterium]MYG45043.1 aquaporin family protein [Rhodothermaceae bacterium]
MSPFIGELIGTTILLLLGNAVVANVILKKTKGQGAGWLAINFGWGVAVFIAVFIVAKYSGAHINPAVTLGLALAGEFSWNSVPLYLAAQFLGGALGAFLVWLHYRDHFDVTEDADVKRAVFCTAPAIRNYASNLLSEIIATFVLVFAVLYLVEPDVGLGALDAIPVGIVVLAIGLTLGGTTGYAINPARDLSPRIVHALVPIKNKEGSDWSYAWIPVVGPIIGGLLAGAAFLLIGS